MKNRTVLGILCLILALLLAFGLTPIMNKLSDGRVSVVRMKQDVSQGHKMTEDDIEIVSVGAVNLPSGVIKDKEAVLGKFASSDLWKGDYLFPAKLSDTADSAADVFRSLDGTQVAVSVTIPTFAGGLSGKLLNGDIVSLIVYSSDRKESIAPDALKYVRVITSTTSGGLDRDELTQKEDGTYDLPSTITLLATPEQARLLAEYENSGRIHAALVCRGNEKQAKKLLKAQAEILEEMEAEKHG